MKSLSPAVKKFSLFLFTVLLFSTIYSEALAQQSRKSKHKPSTANAQQPSIIQSVLDTASSIFDDDPYAQFRNVKYSNEGLLSEEEEVKLGNYLHAEIGKKFNLTTEGQARVNRLGQRVVKFSLRPKLQYQFFVYDANEINAFAAPGGRIYVASKLVKMTTDDELASVLAHETGHIVARHSLQALQEQQTVGGVAEIVGAITGIVGNDAKEIGKAAAQLLASPFLFAHSREQEREADYLGIHTMTKAGLNPEGMVTMFEKLQKAYNSEPSLLGSIFASHPDIDERIKNTRYEINRIKQSKKENR